ncbi:MAG: hypothetical protein HFH85_21085 [Lachnospiraceae bacterium]|nr:hypothetical protein [Lachnospiraceae bacterium]
MREAGILIYYGKTTRAKAVTADEQYRLILECRASGMTDYQWCMAHNIKPSIFYNWIRYLRQSGNMEIPAPAGKQAPPGWPEIGDVPVNVSDNISGSVCSHFLAIIMMEKHGIVTPLEY